INDANDLSSLANQQGFTTHKLIDDQATASQVTQKICDIARELKEGDLFLLTFSGHGGQIPDENNMEEDGLNETWCLWDRQLIDDELYNLWSKFPRGCRIFVLSDSCHSGTMIKPIHRRRTRSQEQPPLTKEVVNILKGQNRTRGDWYDKLNHLPEKRNVADPVEVVNPPLRFMPIEQSLQDYENKRDLYLNVKNLAGPKNNATIGASLIYISGCQDNQYSYDGNDNGFFTGMVLQTWDRGGFDGTHRVFYEEILAEMPPYQTPNYLKLGSSNTEFEVQRPFTIDEREQLEGPDPAGKPSIDLPAFWSAADAAPTVTVDKAGQPYFYIEIATESRLFDHSQAENDQTSSNFYATWNDPQVNSRLTGSAFTIPSYAWERLKQAEQLYFRIGTTTSLSSWDNWIPSFYDTEYNQAPAVRINRVGGDQSGNHPGGNSSQDNCVIIAAVGPGQANRREDVKLVQELLNSVDSNAGGPSQPLVEDGLYGRRTG
ncbi:MAG: caspase family protein, partial [Bacteroidota bacterium]